MGLAEKIIGSASLASASFGLMLSGGSILVAVLTHDTALHPPPVFFAGLLLILVSVVGFPLSVLISLWSDE